jgi:hypothetical protein
MEKPLVTIFYTANLRGDIELLPRLNTFLRQLRAEMHPLMVLDLGNSCAPEVWHCEITEGRSMLVALDGMGYTTAHVPIMSEQNRAKLNLTMVLVDQNGSHIHHNILLSSQPLPLNGAALCVSMTPTASSYIEDGTLHLENVEAGQIGVAIVALNGPALITSEVKILLPATSPDPTIAGAVDFILDEARYYQKRQNEKKD